MAKVSEEVKKDVRSILISNPKGVKLTDFNRDYRKLLGHDFEYKRLGFPSFCDFIQSIPDVAKLEWSTSDQCYRMFAVTDGNLYLPSAPKIGTRPASGRSQCVPISQREAWASEMVPNRKGQYAVSFSRFVGISREDISDEFSKAGEIAEVSMTGSYVFIRYKSKEEALNAMDKFHARYNLFIPKEGSKMQNLTHLKPKQVFLPEKSSVPSLMEVWVGNLSKNTTQRDILLHLNSDMVYQIHEHEKDDKRCMFLVVKCSDVNKVIQCLYNKVINGRRVLAQLSDKYMNLTLNLSEDRGVSCSSQISPGHTAGLQDLDYEKWSSSENIDTCGKHTASKMAMCGGASCKHDLRAGSSDFEEVLPELPDLEPALPELEPALPDLEPVLPDLEPALPDLEPALPPLEPIDLNSCDNIYRKQEYFRLRNQPDSKTPSVIPVHHDVSTIYPTEATVHTHLSHKSQPTHHISQPRQHTPQDIHQTLHLTNHPALHIAKPDQPTQHIVCHSRKLESIRKDRVLLQTFKEGAQVVHISNFEHGTHWTMLKDVFIDLSPLRIVVDEEIRTQAVMFVKDKETAHRALEYNGTYLRGRKLLVYMNEGSKVEEEEEENYIPTSITVNIKNSSDNAMRKVRASSDSVDDSVEDIRKSLQKQGFTPDLPSNQDVETDDWLESKMKDSVRGSVALCCPGCAMWTPSDLSGTLVDIIITNIINKTYIWGQVIDPETKEELDWLLEKTGEMQDEKNHMNFTPGVSSCTAMFDNEWFRGYVREVKRDTASVFALDYGNIVKVPLRDLRDLPADFWEVTAQAWPLKIVSSVFDDVQEIADTKVRAQVVNKNSEEPLLVVKILE